LCYVATVTRFEESEHASTSAKSKAEGGIDTLKRLATVRNFYLLGVAISAENRIYKILWGHNFSTKFAKKCGK